MEHSFDVMLAQKYGVNAAVLLKHFEFWIAKNKANGKNYFDGKYWTYNSRKAFAELFPYMNARQIDYALKKLIDGGLIITGNYNQSTYNRTLWYAITKKGYCILQNCEMEVTKLENGFDNIVEPIPDINTDINTDIKEKNKKEKTINDIIAEQKEELQEPLREYVKMRKAIKKPLTTHAMELALKRLSELASDTDEAAEIINQSIMNSWQGFFPLTKVSNNQTDNHFRHFENEREYTKEELDKILINVDDFKF